VPEWYFLPFYAILRAVPDIPLLLFTIPAKLAGVIAMFGSIGVLFVLPWLDTSPVRSSRFRPIYKWFFWLLVLDALSLGMVGAHRPDAVIESVGISYLVVGRVATLYYFFHFLILLPLLGKLERPLPLPTSISEAVLKGRSAAVGKA
jgi:ubiquinol-cytochrome c reductase cytochrome b/c1 subunit